jgi:hypothetical protein
MSKNVVVTSALCVTVSLTTFVGIRYCFIFLSAIQVLLPTFTALFLSERSRCVTPSPDVLTIFAEFHASYLEALNCNEAHSHPIEEMHL